MLLTTALFKSRYSVAFRRRRVGVSYGKSKYEYQIAFVSHRNGPKAAIFVFTGRTGNIHRISAVEQGQEDWHPFQEKQTKFMIGIQKKPAGTRAQTPPNPMPKDSDPKPVPPPKPPRPPAAPKPEKPMCERCKKYRHSQYHPPYCNNCYYELYRQERGRP